MQRRKPLKKPKMQRTALPLKLGKGLLKVSKPAGKLTLKRAELNKIKQDINRPIKGLMLSHSADLNGFYLSYLLYVSFR